MTKKEALKMLEAIERYYFYLHAKAIMDDPGGSEYDGSFENTEDMIHSLAATIKESTAEDGDVLKTLEQMIEDVQETSRLYK